MEPTADYFTGLLFPRMMQQYKDDPSFTAWIQATSLDFNLMDSVLFDIINSGDVAQATGVSLEQIGSLFQVTRQGRNDTDYRTEILRQQASRQYGTPEDLIRVAKTILGAAWVKYVPMYPKGCALFSDIVLDRGTLDSVAPAGVWVANADYLKSGDGDYLTDGSGNRLFALS